MSDRLIDVEGVGPAHGAKLAEQGLTTTDDLLERGARPAGRAALAAATGISPSLILEWVNHADMFRIKGVAGQFADLLEEAGVDTVAELSRRNPDNLAKALGETSAARNLTNRVPSTAEVAGWVEQAKGLPRAVFYDDSRAGATPAPAAAVPQAEPTPAPAPAPEPTPAPVTAPPTLASPTPAADTRGWLARLVDKVRGR